MTEQTAKRVVKKQPLYLAIQVIDNQGNVISFNEKNIKVVSATRKFDLDLYKATKDNDGSFIVEVNI